MRSRRRFVSAVTVWSLLIGASTIGAVQHREVEVKGRVLASFDEDYALLETKSKMFRIRVSELSSLQRQNLKRLSSEMKLRVPASAIDLSWSIYPSRKLGVPVVRLEQPPKAMERLKSHDGYIEIVGRKLPSIPSETAFVQVNNRVYVIHKDRISVEARENLESGEVNAVIPQGSLLFSWKIDSAKPQQAVRERHSIELAGNNVKIVGRALHSFEEPYALIQADNAILRLQRANLSKEQGTLLNDVGSTVNMKVPGEAISYLWRVGEDKEPVKMLQMQ